MNSDHAIQLFHIGLVVSSEANADRFYGDLLGLPRTRKAELPAVLADTLFGVDAGCDILYYGEPPLVFEVFVTGWREVTERKISHTCIEVSNYDDLLRRCRAMGFCVREAPRGDRVVVFIEDNDGNLFEVKQKP